MIIKINDYDHLNDVIQDNIDEINHWIEPTSEHYFIRYNSQVEPFKLVWENHCKHFVETFKNPEFYKMLTEKKNYLLQLNFTVNYDILNQENHEIFYHFTIIDRSEETKEINGEKEETPKTLEN